MLDINNKKFAFTVAIIPFLASLFLLFIDNNIALLNFSLTQIIICLITIARVKKLELFNTYYSLVILFLVTNTFTNGFWILYANDTNITNIGQLPLVHAWSIFVTLFVLFISIDMLFEAYKKTQNTQMIIDSVIKALIYGSFFWLVLFGRNNELNEAFSFSKLYFLADISVWSIIVTIFFSLKKEYLSSGFKLIAGSISLYCAYNLFVSIPLPESANIALAGIAKLDTNPILTMNITYFLIFGTIYFTILLSVYSKNKDKYENEILNDENKYLGNKNFLFLFFPIAASLFLDKLNLSWFSALLLLLLIHRILNYHILNIKYNKEIFLKEQSVHSDLERQIESYKKRLDDTNKTLKYLSQFDSITKTLNRHSFLDKLNEMITQKPHGYCINIYIVDINKFKAINDTYGNYAGDLLLKALTDKIIELLPKSTIIGRFDSDDIIIAIQRHYKQNDLTELATYMISEITHPFEVEEKKITINIKIGITSTNTNEIKAQELVSQAEIALNNARINGDDYAFFCEKLRQKMWEQTKIDILLNSIDFDKEFEIVYQPQFEIQTKKLVCVEALLRWNNPIKGNIPPSVFIPIAEQSPIIIRIGSWVLHKAVSQISELNARFNTELKISINVSPRQIENVNFINEVLECISKNNIKPEQLNLEITEMNWIRAEDVATGVIASLTESKVFIALDDFGTGFSSLEVIKKYHINKIKIAKELIDDIHIQNTDRKIVTAIISMAKNMGIKTLAEGVESKEQLEELKKLGCDEIQGYVWSKPINLSDLIELVRENSNQDTQIIQAEIIQPPINKQNTSENKIDIGSNI